jgi:Flp pilus assembly protein TadB
VRTEDVTGQVVDLRARIANLQVTEKALQGIMTQATKISDVLAVQAELTIVRGQIEEATAQKQHLEAQAAFSTLTVGFGLKPEAAVVASQKKFDPGNEVDQATASLVEVLQGLATAGIWFGIVWLPILLVLGLAALVVVLLVRRRLPRGGSGASGGLDDGPAPTAPPSSTGEPQAPPAEA